MAEVANRSGRRSLSTTARAIGIALVVMSSFGYLRAQEVPAPTDLTAAADGADVQFTWTAYYFDYRLEAGSAPRLADLGTLDFADAGLDRVHTIGGVPPGTYYVRLRGIRFGVVSPPSNEVAITVLGCAPPPATTDLADRVIGDTVVLTWQGPGPSCGPTTYLLEAGHTPGAIDVGIFNIGTALGDSRSKSFFAAAVPPGDYFARIRAGRAGAFGPPSNEVSFSVACQQPKAIFDFAVEVTGNSALFSWRTDNAAVTNHSVVLEVGSGPGLSDLAMVPLPDHLFGSPYFSYSAMGPAGTYYTRIRTSSPCGSRVSSELVVTLLSECFRPGFPSAIDATLGGSDLYVSASDPVSGGAVLSYTFEAGTAPGASDVGRQVVSRQSYGGATATFSNIPSDRVFVRAIPENGCGRGPRSYEGVAARGACPSPPRPFLLIPSVSGNTVRLTWNGFTEGGTPPYPTFIEIGTAPFGRDVFVGGVHPAGDNTEVVTLAPGRYFVRAISVQTCGQAGNPSSEQSFEIAGPAAGAQNQQ